MSLTVQCEGNAVRDVPRCAALVWPGYPGNTFINTFDLQNVIVHSKITAITDALSVDGPCDRASGRSGIVEARQCHICSQCHWA